jgi:hypothetical protein
MQFFLFFPQKFVNFWKGNNKLLFVQIELENCMSTAKVTGFAKVLVAPTFRVGKTYAIQSSGLGSLEPNTLVMGWPSKWREEGHENSAEVRLCCV